MNMLTTHIDKGHVHNHIIFCAVNFVDYHKYNSNKRSYYGIRNISDRLCYENGLSVITPEKGQKGKSYIEYHSIIFVIRREHNFFPTRKRFKSTGKGKVLKIGDVIISTG